MSGAIEAGTEQLSVDRRLVALVSAPAVVPFFAAMGFASESHGHPATHLRRGRTEHEPDPAA
jgi:hypothetical protein